MSLEINCIFGATDLTAEHMTATALMLTIQFEHWLRLDKYFFFSMISPNNSDNMSLHVSFISIFSCHEHFITYSSTNQLSSVIGLFVILSQLTLNVSGKLRNHRD